MNEVRCPCWCGLHHHQARPGGWHPGIITTVRLDCHCTGRAAHSPRPIHHGHCHLSSRHALPGQFVLLATSLVLCLRPQLHSYAESTDGRHIFVLSLCLFLPTIKAPFSCSELAFSQPQAPPLRRGPALSACMSAEKPPIFSRHAVLRD